MLNFGVVWFGIFLDTPLVLVTNQPFPVNSRFLSLSFKPLWNKLNKTSEESNWWGRHPFVLYPDFHLWSQQYQNSTNSTNHEQGLKLALMSSINVAVLRPLKVGWPGSHAEMYMESPLQSQPVASGCQWRGGIFLWMIHLHSAKLAQAMEKVTMLMIFTRKR